MMTCEICKGLGWVCEEHPLQAWDERIEGGCQCSPGMPCECNSDAQPMPGAVVVVENDNIVSVKEHKLYEFSAIITCNLVIAATSKEAANKQIESYERHWFEGGDIIGVNDVELVEVREPNGQSMAALLDEAHEIASE